MKITFITTVYNEEHTISAFLTSLNRQSKQPDEIVIVDGGSSDKTVFAVSNFKFKVSKNRIKILSKKGNRSVGRNEAIRQATGDIIVCSDSGNILDRDWIKHIVQPFIDKNIDVVAGYYEGKAENSFQKSLIPYALVMPDKVDRDAFLPATRSVSFTKKIWQKVGKFDEKLSHNEDYAFAHALKKSEAKMVFAKDAIVYWLPRNTFKDAYIMFLRFAYGDAESGIIRPKVILVFVRYIIWFMLLYAATSLQSVLLFEVFVLTFLLYVIWAILKNYKYVNQLQGLYYLPLLQLTADGAVLSGTIQGVFKVWDTKKTQ